MVSTAPSKEMVRIWLLRELSLRRPPPDPRQIRRELAWGWSAPERGERRAA